MAMDRHSTALEESWHTPSFRRTDVSTLTTTSIGPTEPLQVSESVIRIGQHAGFPCPNALQVARNVTP